MQIVNKFDMRNVWLAYDDAPLPLPSPLLAIYITYSLVPPLLLQADIICDDTARAEAEACPEGYVCEEASNSEEGVYYPCREVNLETQ